MNNKEEAEKAWTFKAVEKSQGLSYFALPYLSGISDFKAALIQAVEKAAKEMVMHERNKDKAVDVRNQRTRKQISCL